MSAPTAVRATTHDLVRFLLARVDDDVAELKKLARQQVASGNLETTEGVRAIVRLQAEAASKRRMIGALQQLLVLRDQPLEKTVRDQATQMLRVLAVPYDRHSAYRPEWRPAQTR